MRNKRFKWWHGAAFYVAVQITQWGLRQVSRRLRGSLAPIDRRADREWYQSNRLPVFAPPGITFPIAWGINSISAIAGSLYVLNLPLRKRGRGDFLKFQAGAWILFTAFDTAYFELRSPMNAALVTLAFSGLTAASINVAVRDLKDPKIALSLATTVAWLTIANPVAIAQALWNHDELWNLGPFCAPPQRSEKSPQ